MSGYNSRRRLPFRSIQFPLGVQSWDEPRFAQATVEMLHSGNWLYPTFNGAVRADKPILVYWLMAA